MKIAMLAWGSLIWEPHTLQTASCFVPFGPILPVEFSRMSGAVGKPKRLTLVMDEANGSSCHTYTAKSELLDLDKALLNLWVREGSDAEKLPTCIRESGRVGFVDLTSGTSNAKALKQHPGATETIRSWATATGHDAVIWTALGSNFHEDE